ncbi:hypothetical protein L5G28_02075 [Gordonia sp. HY285]|uniref:hypothetical protein n=1 Tax=Gordonia liuliyuniae TaxID=2911517 RepID=UPI001F2E9403|nr:hypothetical protein [Gordonia liuliyuniae]MCF8608953.1 hypothetical protein [Gordonia liuliyuniae]
MSQTLRAVGSILAVATFAVTVAACGQSEPVDPETQRALDSVLSAADFPTGYSVVKLGKDDEKAISEQLDDSRKDAKVTPAACESGDDVPDSAETGSVVASDGESTLSQSVVASSVDAEALAAAVTGECARVRVEVTTGAASGTIVDITHADVTTPSIDGHRGVVFRQVSTVPGDGSERRQLLIGRVPVDGYLVTVQAVDADGSAPDRPAFDATLTAAVRKVADAR